MEVYELFDSYLQKAKLIRDFCSEREQMLFESVRMDMAVEAKIHWLNSVGKEIDDVIANIERLADDRKPQFNMKK